MVLIILSVIVIILVFYVFLCECFGIIFNIFEVLIIIIFSLEYGFCIWIVDFKYLVFFVSKVRLKFISFLMGMVDLIVILFFYLFFVVVFDLWFFRLLCILCLLCVLKLKWYFCVLKIIVCIFLEKRFEFFIILFVIFIFLLIFFSVMYNLENEV